MAFKKGPLSKVEKFFIEGNCTEQPEKMAEELNRSVETINGYLRTLPARQDRGNEIIQNNKKVGVVMTQSQGEKSDEFRQNRTLNKFAKNCIVKPRPDK